MLDYNLKSNSCANVAHLEIDPSQAGQRIDNFLLAYLKGVPRSLVYRILRSGEVRLNRCRVKPDRRLTAGDRLRLPPVRRPEPHAPAMPSEGLKARLGAAILYEDERLLIVDKPAGLAVHGGSGINLGVIEALRALRPRAELELVHRLDRDTSGCLLISKHRATLRWLHQQLRDGLVEKRYLALLAGPLPGCQRWVDAPLRKNQPRGGERLVEVDPHAGKPARTLFVPLRRFAGATLAEVMPRTGRTHQIRVHAAHLGAPVAGDVKYGKALTVGADWRALGLERLFLHAASLRLRLQPDSAPLRVDAPLPAALARVLEALAATSAGAPRESASTGATA